MDTLAGAPRAQSALREAHARGETLQVAEYMAKWADPKHRASPSMIAAGQNAQVLFVPIHCYMYGAEAEFVFPSPERFNDSPRPNIVQARQNRLIVLGSRTLLNVPVRAQKRDLVVLVPSWAPKVGAGGSNFGVLN